MVHATSQNNQIVMGKINLVSIQKLFYSFILFLHGSGLLITLLSHAREAGSPLKTASRCTDKSQPSPLVS